MGRLPLHGVEDGRQEDAEADSDGKHQHARDQRPDEKGQAENRGELREDDEVLREDSAGQQIGDEAHIPEPGHDRSRPQGTKTAGQQQTREDHGDRVVRVAEEQAEELHQRDFHGKVSKRCARAIKTHAVLPFGGQAAAQQEPQGKEDGDDHDHKNRGGQNEKAELKYRDRRPVGRLFGKELLVRKEVPPEGEVEEERSVVGRGIDGEGIAGDVTPLAALVVERHELLIGVVDGRPRRRGLEGDAEARPLRTPGPELFDLGVGEGRPLHQQGREVAGVLGQHHHVFSRFRDAPTAQSSDRGGERAEHFPGGHGLEPHHVQNTVFGQPAEIEVEGFGGVEVVLREHMGGPRGAAVGINARELNDVVGLGCRGQIVAAFRVHEPYSRI